MKYTPPPEPMTDVQFYCLLGVVVILTIAVTGFACGAIQLIGLFA